MRLIDADEAREKMLKLLDHHLMMCNYSADSATQDCIEVINEATVVDAVEVVRCGECKHFRNLYSNIGKENYQCMRLILVPVKVDCNGFCSYGERNEVTK